VTEELHVNSREYLRHALATVAYRSDKVLRGVPLEFGSFRAGPGSRTPAEILAHLCDLVDWARSLASGRESWHDSAPGPWDGDVERFFAAVRALDDALAGEEPLECPWTRLFQGPMADALTHVGQLAMLRRLAGSAVRGENYFRAKIEAGRVGLGPPAPRRDFD
jgi:hypothetical protein